MKKLNEEELKKLEESIKTQNPPDRLLKIHPTTKPIETLSDEVVLWNKTEKRYYPKKEKIL